MSFSQGIYHNPSNNVPRILIETHETPFLGSIWRKINLEIKLIKVLTNSVNIVLSNKYLEAIIQSLESKIFNEKVEGLFYKIRMIENKTLWNSSDYFNLICAMELGLVRCAESSELVENVGWVREREIIYVFWILNKIEIKQLYF